MKPIVAIVIAAAAVAVLFFLLSYAEIAFFDFQCYRMCNECSSVPRTSWMSCMMIHDNKFGCMKDCRVRDFTCSFDMEFKQVCDSCIDSCSKEYASAMTAERIAAPSPFTSVSGTGSRLTRATSSSLRTAG